MTTAMPAATRTLLLGPDEVARFDAPDECIEVVQGQAWLTEDGRLDDMVLAAGGRWPVGGRPVVVTAMALTRLRVVGARSSGASALAGWGRRMLRAAGREVRRLQLGPVHAP